MRSEDEKINLNAIINIFEEIVVIATKIKTHIYFTL
jgi:hypothetical protein